MLLMPGKTCDDGIKFFDNMQWGGLNDRRNAIPHVGSADFAQMMNPAQRAAVVPALMARAA